MNYIDNIEKWNTTSTLHVFTLAPQPLVVELGHLLAKISNIEIYHPHKKKNCGVTWDWEKSNETVHYFAYPEKTKKDIVVINLSLNTLIAESMIERVLGSEASIWTLTIKEPHDDFLKSKNQLADFKLFFRDTLDIILGEHDNCSELHVFLSVPIPIAFEIGHLWDPDSDPDLILYGLSSESGDYYPIHTIKKNE